MSGSVEYAVVKVRARPRRGRPMRIRRSKVTADGSGGGGLVGGGYRMTAIVRSSERPMM